MADPLIWGPVGWSALFDIARRVDLVVAQLAEGSLETAREMQKLIVIMSFCWPCDNCAYFGVEYTVACPPPLMLFTEYLFDMKSTVDAKIKTIKYGKTSLEECIAPHLSRIELYERQTAKATVDAFPMDEWAKLFVLSAKHAESHEDRSLIFLAINEALRIVCAVGRIPKLGAINSFEDALAELSSESIASYTRLSREQL
jgi:hypothetical protein